MYRDREIPAVHPRYSSIYGGLYPDEERYIESGTFGVRLFLSLLLFALFVSIDYDGRKILNVSSDQIADEIRIDTDVEEVWKNL